MLDLLSLLSPMPAAPAPVRVTGGNDPAADAFAQTLGAFLDAGDAASDTPPGPAARQVAAGDGKTLPAAADPDDPDDAAAAMPWLPTPIAPMPMPMHMQLQMPIRGDAAAATLDGEIPMAMAAPATLDPPSPPVADPDVAQAAQATARPIPHGAVVPPVPISDPDVRQTAAPDPASVTMPQLLAAASPVDVVAAIPVRVSEPAKAAVPPPPAVVADPATPAIAVSATPQPAAQTFAAALATAAGWHDRAARIEHDRPADAPAIAAGSPLVPGERPIVQAAGDARGSALDLTRDPGLQRMIDRIETRIEAVRDDADARDTHIRLVPDALGGVDVAVRQEGERVHVRFTVENDATRLLLVEAQPRLAELAADRGVRIGTATVALDTASDKAFGGGGGGGGGATPQPRPVPRPGRTPAGRRTADDLRLA